MVKKIASSLLWLGSLPLCIYALVTYLLSYSLIVDHWIAGFLMMTMPIALLGCVSIALIWLFVNPSRAILPFCVLLIGYPFIRRTIALGSGNKIESSEQSFTILDYNVFGFYAQDAPLNQDKARGGVAFAHEYKADIKCFQEFLNYEDREDFHTLDLIKKDNPYWVSMHKNIYHGETTLITFSKYPIIHSEHEQFGSANTNGYLIADIAFPNDTIRVINFQLQSMGIRVANLVSKLKEKEVSGVKEQSRDIFSSLKMGFVTHAKQVKVLEDLIEASPYPVMLTGDLNEMPYGYSYGRLSDRLSNAFEEAGHGFGLTLNRSPRFVRIDNQFYSNQMEAVDFQTLRNIPYSDHYPIVGNYLICK
jgi:endonuclease/exonuclease/phosphatase family metal-dependent hydrolase